MKKDFCLHIFKSIGRSQRFSYQLFYRKTHFHTGARDNSEMEYLQYNVFGNDTSFNNIYMTRECKNIQQMLKILNSKNNNNYLHLTNS